MMDNDLVCPIILDGSIRSVKFGIATPNEIRTFSVNDFSITHASQLMNPFLGLPLESGNCESCGTLEVGKCEGHFGFIDLPTPVYHPFHVSHLKTMLNLVCLKCLRVKKSNIKLDLGTKSTKSASCPYCRGLPPISVDEVTKDGAISLELKVSTQTMIREGFWKFLDKYGFHYYDDSYCRPLLPSEVLEMLKRIPEDTRRKLTAKGHIPQYGYILQSIPVPPNCLHVPDISDGKSSMCNDISIPMLKKVLNKVDLIKKSRSGPPNFESHMIESNDLQVSIAQYMRLRGTKKAPFDNSRKMHPSSEANNSSGKQWLEKMRSLFISKGSGYSSRSIITGDSYKGINEIGIPSEIANKITFEERVTALNLKRLQELVDNRQCLRYGDGLSTYSTEEGSKGYTYLRVGQVVNRKIMDGDIVFINRPPTTHKHALQAFSVYVHNDHTVKINPLICAPFNADFDGDCVHIFYPQSLTARAEVMELFSVEQQLCSSHSGKMNLKLVNDSLLALKMMSKASFLRKETAQQLGMSISSLLPQPALVKANSVPFWTVLQILQNSLPDLLSCSGERHLIKNGEILRADLSRGSLQAIFSDVATSIMVSNGPKDTLKFVNLLQQILMEFLFLEGFSFSLEDFYVSEDILDELKYNVQKISCTIHQLRSSFNDLIYSQVENNLKDYGLPIAKFILGFSSLGDLIDSKSDSAILKLVQQLGFVGWQLSLSGKLYSRSLVDDIYSHYVEKYSMEGDEHPSQAYGLIKNSFFDGLNPYEELIHSISAREVTVRSTRGLAEPGTLFKNLMAILRDVAICYDGTVRNICSNSVIQFEYEVDRPESSILAPPGEPVGVLAATSVSDPAYKAVLDPRQTTNSSWELMKEVLLLKTSFSKDAKSRRVILYLKDSMRREKFYKEKAACIVKSFLRSVTLKECVLDFSIIYQNKTMENDCPETVPGLVGHIHLDETRLSGLNLSSLEILQKCEDAIINHRKKKGHFKEILKRVALSSSENCSHPCIQFSFQLDSSNSDCDMQKDILIMANSIYPFLMITIIKGDPRIHSATITWVDPNSTHWVKSSCKKLNGEVAIDLIIENSVVKKNGDAWRIAMDSCIPVIKFIDTTRSIPYGIPQIQDLLGISCAFDQSVQRLSTAIKTVSKGVLKEHLMLVANSMTCTGNAIGFYTSGYKALFRSLNIQVPFTEATLVTPLKCFERAAEKCHIDSLSSIVGSSLWGKNIAIGTGTCFQILWKQKDVQSEANIGNDVYDFLHMVRATTGEMESDTCLGVDMDNLVEENGDLSPDHDLGFVKPTFDDSDICLNHENPQNEMQDKWDMDSSNWNTESQGWGVSKMADATSSKNAAWDENNSLGGDVGGSDSSNWNKQAQSEPPESQGWGVSKMADTTFSKTAAWGENNSLDGDVGGSDSSNWNKQAHSEPPESQEWGMSKMGDANFSKTAAWVDKNKFGGVAGGSDSSKWKKQSKSEPPESQGWEVSNMNGATSSKTATWGEKNVLSGSVGGSYSSNWNKNSQSQPSESQGWGVSNKGDVASSKTVAWGEKNSLGGGSDSSNWNKNSQSQPSESQGWGVSNKGDATSSKTVAWGEKNSLGGGSDNRNWNKHSQSEPSESQRRGLSNKGDATSKIATWGEKNLHGEGSDGRNWNKHSQSELPESQRWGLSNKRDATSPKITTWGEKNSLGEGPDSSNWNKQSQSQPPESQGWVVSKMGNETSSKTASWGEKNSLGGGVGDFDSSNWNKHSQSEPSESQGWGVPKMSIATSSKTAAWGEKNSQSQPPESQEWGVSKMGNETSSKTASWGEKNLLGGSVRDSDSSSNWNKHSQSEPSESQGWGVPKMGIVTSSKTAAWGENNSQSQPSESQEWGMSKTGGENSFGECVGVSDTPNKWDAVNRKKQPEYQAWGPSNNGERKNKKFLTDQPKNRNLRVNVTTTGRRLDNFTSEEEKILSDVEPIVESVKKIFRSSSDGLALSEDDQKFIVDKVLHYHPDIASKVSGEIDYVMVDKHTQFINSRCFFVVSTDGSKSDFSYTKCVKNFISQNYDNAENFNDKYFPKPRRTEQLPPPDVISEEQDE